MKQKDCQANIGIDGHENRCYFYKTNLDWIDSSYGMGYNESANSQ